MIKFELFIMLLMDHSEQVMCKDAIYFWLTKEFCPKATTSSFFLSKENRQMVQIMTNFDGSCICN